MKILIITRSDDNESVDLVSHALKRMGHLAIRFDTDRYPQQLLVESNIDAKGRMRRRMETPWGALPLEQLRGLWYRRYFAGGRLPQSLGDTRQAAIDESRRTLYGTIAATPCFQLDPLASVRSADHKELQLTLAGAFGLPVPKTLITNSPEAVLRFVESLKGAPVISKMQHSFAIMRDGREHVVYTNDLRADDLDDLQGLQYSPMTFQEKLEKRLELRATVVGKRVFTAAIDSQKNSKAATDWRRQGRELINDWEPYTLPSAVERGLLKLTKRFGLNYAAADFVVTPKGKHVFLEINAGGEFMWLARKPGLPIPQAIAEVLTTPSARAAPGLA